jgi:hypothetical protein
MIRFRVFELSPKYKSYPFRCIVDQKTEQRKRVENLCLIQKLITYRLVNDGHTARGSDLK